MLRRDKRRGRGAREDARLLSVPEYIPKMSLATSRNSKNTFLIEDSPNSDEGLSIGQRYNQDSGHPKSTSQIDKTRVLICSVCGENASGQYFGALVCLPCKSFYIRCTKDGEPVFSPRCHGNCEVTKKSRIRCQSCRFQKCVRAGMCRREKPERVNPKEGQFLCKVCGDIANGIHFGVFTCEGCKKFFRRGLTENNSFKCKGHNRCVMNPRSRNACRACRYRQCISVGMSREAIKMGRPKKRSPLSPRLMTAVPYSPEHDQGSGDLILMSCNESDTEDVEMIDIPLTKEEIHSPDTSRSVADSPHIPLTPSSDRSPNDLAQRHTEYSWKEQQPFPSSMNAGSYVVSYPLTSTVTSEPDYTTIREKSISGLAESDKRKVLNDLPGSSLPFPETGFHDPSVRRGDVSQDESDSLSLYSLSNEDIDTMLRLLGDFEKPKLSPFRRRLQFRGNEIHKQPKLMKYEDFDPGLRNLENEKGPDAYTNPLLQQNITHHLTSSPSLPLKVDTFDQTTQASVKPRPNSGQESRYGPQADAEPYDEYKSTFYSSNIHSSSAVYYNCRWWLKKGSQDSSMEALRKRIGISSQMDPCQQSASLYKPETQSIGEIGKAFEVLYDKVGCSSVLESSFIGENGSSAGPAESW